MPPDNTKQQIEVMFSFLNKGSASSAIPAPGTLSKTMTALAKKAPGDSCPIDDPRVLSLFATASVEMWQRSIHSFLISASLTKASPLWASVSGYYSSHYSIRAFAHLLGHFLLTKEIRAKLRIEVAGKGFICHIDKRRGDGEHQFYWRVVRKHELFANNPLFTDNAFNKMNDPFSDAGHRCKANYLDHIDSYPPYSVLDLDHIKQRVEKISTTYLSAVPIPNEESYPDVDAVQLIAYHRMIWFRKFLNGIVQKNRFWSFHSNPGWCKGFLSFQVVEPEFLSAYKERFS